MAKAPSQHLAISATPAICAIVSGLAVPSFASGVYVIEFEVPCMPSAKAAAEARTTLLLQRNGQSGLGEGIAKDRRKRRGCLLHTGNAKCTTRTTRGRRETTTATTAATTGNERDTQPSPPCLPLTRA